jgi:hypothetical protein
MSKMVLETANYTVGDLLGNGRIYIVPPYQRNYSWQEEHWDDLWQDISQLRMDDHYLGYVVLQTRDNKSFQIIDGQQRFTTFCILVLAVLKAIQDLVDADMDAAQNRERIKTLKDKFLGFTDPVSLVTKNKLKLNRINEGFYVSYLLPLRVDEARKRSLNSSDKLLCEAFFFFYEKVKQVFPSETTTGESYAEFITNLASQLFFSVVTVPDDLNAYTVFETINARGVQLSPSDLLKNYLFSEVASQQGQIIHEEELFQLEQLWNNLVERLGEEDISKFIRAYWNSKFKLVRSNMLFKEIKREIKGKGAVFDLLRHLNDYVDIYTALQKPDADVWDAVPEQKEYVTTLRLFRVVQPLPMLMAAYTHFSSEDFTELLRLCVNLSFRYNVIMSKNPNDLEPKYSEIAIAISNQTMAGAKEVKLKLREIYPDDDRFIAEFTNKTFKTARSVKLVKYILFNIERQVSGAAYDEYDHAYTVEHILPKSPAQVDDWQGLSNEDIAAFSDRLGNLVVLERSLNKQGENLSFEYKKDILKQSIFTTTQKVVERDTWTKDTIKNRQKYMATIASSIWKINF